jgi:fatty-acyl-CoA synthase
MTRATIGAHGLTLQHLLWRMEHLFSEKTLWDAGADEKTRECNYGEVVKQATQVARVLADFGLDLGTKVATLGWNERRHFVALLAIACSGGVVVPLNPRSPLDHLTTVVGQADVAILLVDPSLTELAKKIADARPSLTVLTLRATTSDDWDAPDLEALAARQPDHFEWPPLDENMPVQVSYTSGTTGPPKGVVYSHRSQMLHALMSLGTDTLGVCEDDMVLPAVPFFHANSQGLPYAALLAGASLVLPGRQAGEGDFLSVLVGAHNVSCLGAVPTQVYRLLAASGHGRRLNGTRIISGGSAVSQELIDQVARRGGELRQVWGMTETSPIALVTRPRSGMSHGQARDAASAQGRPVPGVEMELRGIGNRELLSWDGATRGELSCRGPWIVNDYLWGEWPDENHEWLRTGDLVTISYDGYVRLVDRLKDLIKSGGEWIPARLIETAIETVAGVRECAVIARADVEWGERPVAYLVTEPDFELASATTKVRETLAAIVPSYWIPDEFHMIDSLPRTPTEKVDKVSLRRSLHDA